METKNKDRNKPTPPYIGMASLYDKCVTNDKKNTPILQRKANGKPKPLYQSKIVNSIDKATRKRKQNKILRIIITSFRNQKKSGRQRVCINRPVYNKS